MGFPDAVVLLLRLLADPVEIDVYLNADNHVGPAAHRVAT